MPRHTETIAALATPVGTSALAVLRVSGPDTEGIATALWGGAPASREVRRGDYRDVDGKLLDDVLYVFFRAPRSYTGEDSLEIFCHGNPFIAQRILEDLLARGARAPEPGEFTARAFLNGQLDLSQAEAVMDLIQARGDRAVEAANRQLRGALSERMKGLVGLLTGVVAEVEAYVDFPEEDLPPEDIGRIASEIEHIIREASELRATGRFGELLRHGVRTVIAGYPNVGKSSLLNRLVGHERALVSPEPGTTRDYIEEQIVVGPYCLRVVDTAGLNATPGPLEKLGIAKAVERLREADIVLVVTDASAANESLPPEVQALEGYTIIRVINKIDLLPSPAALTDGTVAVSALTGQGFDTLRALIAARIERLYGSADEAMVAINARHSRALEQAVAALKSACGKIREHAALELLASDLRESMSSFEEIGGRIDNEEILDELFRRFCIGK